MADQQTPNNPNNGTIGISSFGGTPPSNNPVPSTPAPQPAPFPTPSAPVTPPPAPTPPVAPATPVAPMPQPSPTVVPVAPSAPVVPAPAPSAIVEPTPTSNLTNQTFMGGIDSPKEESKNKFGLPSFHSEKDKPAVTTPQTPMQSTPTYNEVTASGSKNKFALIAIIVGVLLLLVAGGGYYYLTFMNQPEEVAVEPEPVVEQPDETIPQETVIDTDPYIMQISQMEATASPEPIGLRNQIQSLDFDQIDSEVQIDTGIPPTPTTPINEPTEPTQP